MTKLLITIAVFRRIETEIPDDLAKRWDTETNWPEFDILHNEIRGYAKAAIDKEIFADNEEAYDFECDLEES